MRFRIPVPVLVVVGLVVSLAAPAVAMSSPYHVLCDTVAGTAYCPPGHSQGTHLTYAELRDRVDAFGAGRMSVLLVSGEPRLGRAFGLLDSAVRIGKDTIPLREIRYIRLRSSWPEWSSVAALTAGGALLFGGLGLVIDGVQWIAGGDADLVATSRGSLVGAVLFGGMGLLFARDELNVLVQPGRTPETVGAPPMHELRAESERGMPVASQSATTKSAW